MTTTVVVTIRPGQARCQGERHGQPVGHADHDVSDQLAGREMPLDMEGLMHRFSLLMTAAGDAARVGRINRVRRRRGARRVRTSCRDSNARPAATPRDWRTGRPG